LTYESVRALLSPKKAQSLYDSLSFIYDPVTRYEKSSLDDALEVAHVDSNSVVLDVGFGTGRALVEFAEKTTVGGVYGLDFSRRMIKKARRKLINHGLSERTHLVLGDAKNIP
jgi:ubiquinone/menaquinone biosynthesis C-methylase UbiE